MLPYLSRQTTGLIITIPSRSVNNNFSKSPIFFTDFSKDPAARRRRSRTPRRRTGTSADSRPAPPASSGKLSRRKLRITPRVLRVLTALRNLLWGVLMALLLTGTCSAWIDYELFTAFIYSSASVWVIVLAVLFLVLSVWVPRPYCRFVCPTGALMKSV